MYYNFKNLLSKESLDHRDRDAKTESVYYRLYRALKHAIQTKSLPDNFRMPPSRILANDLHLSRSTVLKAYDLLIFENLLISKQGSGYYTNQPETDSRIAKEMILQKKEPNLYPKISKLGKSFIRHAEFDVSENYTGSVCFRPGLPPLDIFPIAIWQKLSNDYWKHVQYTDLSYSDSLGMESLRTNISEYLKIYRNITCDPDQIVVTTGSLHSLSLVSLAVLNAGDPVILETPTYKYAFNLFKSLKAKIHPAGLSDIDFQIASLDDIESKLLYSIPSDQYPTGQRMSLKRRKQILDFAAQKNLLIVEDDYDHEFSNWEKPIPAIFSLDINECVIYLGTFNKLLHPSLRLGYMIIPKYLINTITAVSKQTYRFVAPSQQSVMAQFISEDYLNKHLRKVVKVSNERKLFFISYFQTLFKDEIQLEVNNTGLHIIGILRNDVQDVGFCHYLRTNDILAFPLSSYYLNETSRNGLVMGYCSVNKVLIKKNLDKLYALYQKYIHP